ncbi:alpha/beta hydrolase [Rhizobium sp.]|uniref:alpha/beta hydrolase n=1 Tax=Rhizobium sp. TaxID=391 RepID=UPI003917CE6B
MGFFEQLGGRILRFVLRFMGSLSATGVLLALLFFAASLTPSLMPRSWLIQGVLSGACAATGYAFGVFIGWLWRYLELPWFSKQAAPLRATTLLFAIIVSVVFLWHAVEWQNSIRTLWQMQPQQSADPFRLAGVAAITFAVLLALGWLFQLAASRFSHWLDAIMPRKVSNVLGLTLAIAVFWLVGQGLLVRWALDATDASFQKADALIEPDETPPTSPAITGGPGSLVGWDTLGRQGRAFVSTGPKAEAIGEFWQKPALAPIRVYAGLNSAETVEERASLALQELERQGGFKRSLLVVVVPTGTGWVDPAAMDTLEYLHDGDVASVALQYSYLSSWLSLLVEPENGQDAARALFQAVYDHWKTLPKDRRPRLYLHGLSLGALNSQLSTDIYDVVADPFQGALWSGPPFRSARWNAITAMRQKGSPAWLPKFRDGSVVRFANQVETASNGFAPWGPIRMIYLQYASDPVTFFDPSSFFREPAWLRGERGPDVSQSFTWIPVVTGLQLAVDMAIATSSPIGHGHVYAPEHYIDAWIPLTDPAVSADDVTRLKQHFLSAAD